MSINAFSGEGVNPLTRPLEKAVRALIVLGYIEAWLMGLCGDWFHHTAVACVSAPALCPKESDRNQRGSGPASSLEVVSFD